MMILMFPWLPPPSVVETVEVLPEGPHVMGDLLVGLFVNDMVNLVWTVNAIFSM